MVFNAPRVIRALPVCGRVVHGLRCHECDNKVKVKWISSFLTLQWPVFFFLFLFCNCRPSESSRFLPYVYSLRRTVFFSLSLSPTPFLSIPSCCHSSTHVTCIILQTPFSYPRAKDREPQTESEQRIMRCNCCCGRNMESV